MSTKRSDFKSGLVYFGYRFYVPHLGRWLNRDLLQEHGGIKLYGYVHGDPLGYVDPDGRVRYYTKEVQARIEGPTRVASFVTEHNPKNGNVRQWMESYDHSGQVNRVHPKSINGQTINSQHYPPTARELGL